MCSHSSRFCSRASLIFPPTAGMGAWSTAWSPWRRHRGSVLSRGRGDVVDVAGRGRRDEHQQRAGPGAGAVHLSQRQLDPLSRSRGGVKSDLDRDGMSDHFLIHHRGNRQVRCLSTILIDGTRGQRLRSNERRHVAAALAPQGGPRDETLRISAHERAGPRSRRRVQRLVV
jgi:hypothetical protein